MKKNIRSESRTANESKTVEFTLETILTGSAQMVEPFSSINLKFLRMLLRWQLPECTKKAEE